MNGRTRQSLLLTIATLLGLPHVALGPLRAQEKPSPGVVTFTTKEDHQNMLQQLGIDPARVEMNRRPITRIMTSRSPILILNFRNCLFAATEPS
jgi:hypothetical protein